MVFRYLLFKVYSLLACPLVIVTASNQFLIVFPMKLEDIKSAVEHATESEFKRAFYNACAVFSRKSIESMFADLMVEVYEDFFAGSSE